MSAVAAGGFSFSTVFDLDLLLSDGFNTEEFIADCHRRSSNVLPELESLAKSADSELIELINKEYGQFLRLSTDLAGLEPVFDRLEAALHQVKNEVNGAWLKLSNDYAEIERLLADRRALLEKRAALELFSSLEAAVSKAEALLRQEHDLGSMKLDDQSLSTTLERVTNDLNQIRFYCSKGAKHASVQAMQQRVRALEAQTKQTLDALFVRALDAGNTDLVLSAVRAYGALAGQRQAEQIFRRVSVDAALDGLVTPARLSADGLAAMYTRIVDYARSCVLLTQPFPGFAFLVNAVWPSVVQHLEERTPSIFAIGIAKTFHRNCLLSLDFLLALESLCHSPADVQSFRSASEPFVKKWNAAVYYEMRFQEIITAMHAACSFDAAAVALLAADNGQHDYATQQVLAAHAALQSCWDAGTFLPLAVDRFFMLSLQIVSYARSWTDSLLADQQHQLQQLQQLQQQQQQQQSSSSASTSSTQADDQLQNPSFEASVVAACCDVLRLADYLCSTYVDALRALFTSPHLDAAALLTAIESGTRASASALRSAGLRLADSFLQRAVRAATERLRPMHGIAQTYRMMDRPAPTKESFYVAGILQPVAKLLELFKACNAGAGDMLDWRTTAARQLIENFVALAQSFKETLTKQHTSFNRIFRAASASDDEKINIQLYLDVVAFGRQLNAVLAIDPDTFEPFRLFAPLIEPGRLAVQLK